MDDLAGVIGGRIKELRQQRGASQSEFAGRIGVSPSMVNQYERGVKKPSTEVLAAISKLYGVSIDFLFGSTETKGLFMDKETVSLLDDFQNLGPRDRLVVRELVQLLRNLQ